MAPVNERRLIYVYLWSKYAVTGSIIYEKHISVRCQHAFRTENLQQATLHLHSINWEPRRDDILTSRDKDDATWLYAD